MHFVKIQAEANASILRYLQFFKPWGKGTTRGMHNQNMVAREHSILFFEVLVLKKYFSCKETSIFH